MKKGHIIVLLYFLIAGVIVESFSSKSENEFQSNVFLIPAYEEILKLLIAIMIRKRVFELIIFLAICEFVFIKLPVLIAVDGVAYYWLFAMCSIFMHAATAVGYNTLVRVDHLIIYFIFMFFVHALYNSLDFWISDYSVLLIGSFLVASLPLLWFKISQGRGGAS